MTVQLNTYSDISAFIGTTYADIIFAARENNPMAGLVTVLTDMNGMGVRTNQKYGSAVINQIGEDDDLTSQALTPSNDQSLTPYEYGAQFVITDQRQETDFRGIRGDCITELGAAMGAKVDNYLCTLFSGLTAGTTGAGDANMTWANFFAAQTKLRAAFAPQPWICVLHPYQWHCLGTAVAPGVTVTNSPALQDAVVNRWFVGNVAGVDIYLDANIQGTTNVMYGGMYSRIALALDWRRAPRIEPERDASRRAWELNESGVFAYGPWRPQYGVAIKTYGTAPA